MQNSIIFKLLPGKLEVQKNLLEFDFFSFKLQLFL